MDADPAIPFRVSHAEAIVVTREGLKDLDKRLSQLLQIGLAMGVASIGFLGAILAAILLK